jgi:hypothetical protein
MLLSIAIIVGATFVKLTWLSSSFIFLLFLYFSSDEHGWYFWEVTLMLQKMFLTGAMVAIAPGSPIQLLVALVMCLAYLLLVTHAGPYKGDLEDKLAFLTSLCLAISLLLGLTLIMDTPDDPVFNVYAIGIVLIVVNMLPFMFICYAAIEIFRWGPQIGLWFKELTDEEMEEHVQQMYKSTNDESLQLRRVGSKKQERKKQQQSIQQISQKKQSNKVVPLNVGNVKDTKKTKQKNGSEDDVVDVMDSMTKMEFAKIACTVISDTLTAEMVDDLWSSVAMRRWLIVQNKNNNKRDNFHQNNHHHHKKVKRKKKPGFSRVTSIRSLAGMAVVMDHGEKNIEKHQVTKTMLDDAVRQKKNAAHARLTKRLTVRLAKEERIQLSKSKKIDKKQHTASPILRIKKVPSEI